MGQARGLPVSLGHSLDPGWAVAQVNQGLESQVCLLEPDPLCVPCFFLESDLFSSLITRRQFEHIPEFTFAARIF